MAVKLVITPEVETDLAEAYGWYDNRRDGLGDRFLGNVNQMIERITRQPEAHRAVHKTYRRALVRRFPYAIFYEFVTDVVTVHGVLHTASDPKKWRRRLP